MGKRKSYKNESSKHTRILYSTIAALILLLIVSAYTRKDPQSVLSDMVQYALGNKDKISKNDQQWELYLSEKQKEIDSLNFIISDLNNQSLPSSAKVNTTSTGLNLRKLPSLDSDVISKIPNATDVRIYYRDNEIQTIGGETGFWVKISYEGKQGYVFSSYLEI